VLLFKLFKLFGEYILLFKMSSSEDAHDILLACACAITTKLLVKKKQRKRRRWWMRSLYRNKNLYSGSMLLNDLKNEDGDHFKNCCRMSPETFNNLLSVIEPKIKKKIHSLGYLYQQMKG